MTDRPLWTVRGDGCGHGRGAVRDRCRCPFRAFRSIRARSRPAKRSSPSRATTATATNSSRRRSRPAPGSRWSRPTGAAAFPTHAPLLVVADVLDGAARTRAGGARARAGEDRRRHRLRRQDQHQGGAAPGARRGRRDPCLGRLLQQSLGRAAVAGALPRDRALRRVRDRHEPCRRDRAADAPGAAAGGDHHHRRAGASRILPLGRGDRRRQGRNLSRARAGRSGGDQSRQSAVRAPRARRAERRGRAHRLFRRTRGARTRG